MVYLAFFHRLNYLQGSCVDISWQWHSNPVHPLCGRVHLHYIPAEFIGVGFHFKQFQLKLDQVHLKARTLDQQGKCLPIVNLSFLLWFSLASIFSRRGKYQSLPHLGRFPPRSLENRSFWGCRLYCPGRLCGLRSWSGKSSSKIFR